MPLPLDHWQDRLARHFTSLAATREKSAFPIFALEHPLTPVEVDGMASLLRAVIASTGRLGQHWLCWVIYATEVGYRYTGDEYWQSFDEETPGWQFQHRDALRNRFRKFQQTYGGVRPSGKWAANFPIIAWPITHAILPKYLQFQFAYAIYQLRFRLARLDQLDSLSAGRLLAANSYDTSRRFQEFLQQEELTGRILRGLLGISAEDGPAPIYEPTLQRIIADLDGVQATRTRLREARTVVDRFKGIGQGTRGASKTNVDPRGSIDGFVHPDIRPRLLLRYSSGGSWAVIVDVPSFAPVAALQADLAAFLKRTRCRIAGASDVKPAGWVLSHSRVAVLRSWPSPNVPLLVFEQKQSVIDRLLQADCVLSPGSLWLFRIGPDGIAREIVGRTVRPGFDYIVLSPRTALPEGPFLGSCSLDCAGIHAHRITIPANVSAEQTKWLSGLGLQVARTIRVWPAGLPCRGWDGEGQSEWLTTEEPCFGIVHDHPVSQYVVELDGSTEAILPACSSGEPTFIRLQSLPAGKHKLTITAKRHDSLADIAQKSPPEGAADLHVREPEPWVPGIPAHTGLVVTLDPHDADLDEFWENKIVVCVAGPESRSVTCAVALERSDGEEIFRGRIPGEMPLPVTAEAWHRKFAAFLKREEAINWRYPEAAAGRLHIKGGELGEYVAAFHRDVPPVRWITRHNASDLILKLLDDTDLPDDASCRSFSMLRPIAEVKARASEMNGVRLESPGGLYVARHGEHQDALVVSHGLAGHGLQGLGVRPDFSEIATNAVSVTQAILALELWLIARLAGPLAEIRRTQVTRELSAAIFERLCGRRWATAEQTFADASNVEAAADTLQHRIDARTGFGAVLKRDYAKFLDDVSNSSAWYLDLAQRNRVSNDAKMCEFAIRLSFLPQSLSRVYGAELDRFAKLAASKQELIRGARFAALLCARHQPAEHAHLVRRQRWQ